MKIRSRKQLQKVADAVRLLHPDIMWMHIDSTGNVVLTNINVFELEYDYEVRLHTLTEALICMSGFDLKIEPIDTVVQLRRG